MMEGGGAVLSSRRFMWRKLSQVIFSCVMSVSKRWVGAIHPHSDPSEAATSAVPNALSVSALMTDSVTVSGMFPVKKNRRNVTGPDVNATLLLLGWLPSGLRFGLAISFVVRSLTVSAWTNGTFCCLDYGCCLDHALLLVPGSIVVI